MPDQKPTPDHVWEKRITFFSIDTSIIQSAGYNFSKGALNQLPNQLPSSMGLQLTEIVLEEIKNHRMQPVRRAAEQLGSASRDIGRLARVDMGEIDRLFSSMEILAHSEKMFETEVRDYASRCRGGVLPFSELDAGDLFRDYFLVKPPFEEGQNKKFEFPDAAALQLLQRYAEAHNTAGIVVSDDAGWENFAKQSDRLYYASSLDELTAIFVASDKYAEELKAKIGSLITNPESDLHLQIQDAIETHVGNSEWDASDLIAGSGHRLDPEVYETKVLKSDLSGSIEIWPSDEDPRSWVVELTAAVTVSVSVNAEFFVWDSIDREDVSLGSTEADFEEQIEVEIYLTCSNVGSDTSPDVWDINIEIAPGSYSIEPAEMELDYD